ncbi:hypothetical protein F4695_003047 [Rhizobium soli]|uniref:Uncharacterized protein n=1 Tax=Rhizobium soli TaxID=424798 RepID=A0A7X0JMC1_9HYPH|nr:hypothetical protein [Rhizobium soli]
MEIRHQAILKNRHDLQETHLTRKRTGLVTPGPVAAAT